MQVEKRNHHKEPVKFDKISQRIQYLLGGGLEQIIDPAVITQKIAVRVHDGIKTSEIDELSSQICAAMITTHPAFGILAGRIVTDNHQKNTSTSFLDVMTKLYKNVDKNGDPAPLVSEEVFNITTANAQELQDMIDFTRDFDLGYFGFKTLSKAYLKKVNNIIVERPQHMFLRVSLGIHGADLKGVKEVYDFMSQRYYTHATPTLFHSGTPRPQMSSCFLLDGSADSVEGIYGSITRCAKISKWAGGIGVHISGIRGKGAYIRKTGGNSDGIMPMLKVYNDTARYINQSGKRPGSFAMYIEPWHMDIFTFLDAKKNHGQEEERARDLFYALWIPDIFMERVKNNGHWTLMCPDEYPGLTELYGDAFTSKYIEYEEQIKANPKEKQIIPARKLWSAIISSQTETGTPYMLYKNACNEKSNQQNLGTIKSSNLCAEIVEYSCSKENGESESAVCNLASLCLPRVLVENHDGLRDSTITVYTKNNCSWCRLAKGSLKKFNIKFTEVDLEDENERRSFFNEMNDTEKYKNRFGVELESEIKTVPQIIVNWNNKTEQHIGGYTKLWELLRPVVDFGKLAEMAKSVTINLNKIIDKNFYPIESTRRSNLRHRPIGIGVQGLADLFIRLRVPFTSPEAKELNLKLFETIYYSAMRTSCDLAKIDGPYSSIKNSPLSKGKFQFDLWKTHQISEPNYSYTYTDINNNDIPLWDWETLRKDVIEHGVRNSLLTAVMPTASTSQIMGNNECIEPYTSNVYARRTMAGEFTVVNTHLMEDLISLDMWNEEIRDRLLYNRGSVQNIPNFPDHLKGVYKTVWEISQKDCIDMAADRGRFICQSQSLNLWFSQIDFKKLTNAHMYGWKQGLKTGSYYIRSKPARNSQRFTMDPSKEQRFKEEEECLSCGS